MRINRNRSRQIFRRQSRWNGCLSWMTTLLVLVMILFFGRRTWQMWVWQWIAPTDNVASLTDAQIAYRSGDLDTTIHITQSLYGTDHSNTNALETLVRSLIYRSYADLNQDADRTLALSLTTAAVERTPYDIQVLAIHAFALQANEQSEDAQRVALRVIRNDDRQVTARVALSLSYASQGIFEAALRDALRAVEIAGVSATNWRADAYRALAIAYSDLGRYDEAAAAAETAISHNRRLLALHFERALYAQQLGQMDTATAYYFNVIAFDDGNVKARFRLCEVSSMLGERDAAIDWCGQVTELAPGWSDGWYWLGREYYLNGDWRNTQITLNRCSTLQVAQSVTIEDRRFECWYIQGQAAEVLRDCPSLLSLYGQYREMAATADLPQRWTYPDDTPAICASFAMTATP